MPYPAPGLQVGRRNVVASRFLPFETCIRIFKGGRQSALGHERIRPARRLVSTALNAMLSMPYPRTPLHVSQKIRYNSEPTRLAAALLDAVTSPAVYAG